MARTNRARVLAVLATLAVALIFVVPAGAIVYGEPDDGEHPYVGMVGFYDEAGTPTNGCSGTLLSPTVFLTAAHCTVGMNEAQVWFGPQVDQASGFPDTGGVTGTPYTHPDFVGSADTFGAFPNTNDVGIVVLDRPVSVQTYGELPEPGLLDALAAQPGQEQQAFTVVGYGLQGTHPSLLGPTEPERLKATTEFTDLRAALADGYNLRASSSSPENGLGTCYGDSGGPILLAGTSTVVAIQSFVLDENCVGASGGYRTDIANSLDFINGFLG